MDLDEMQIEAEKLKLEREKLALERERLDAAKERLQAQERAMRTDLNGRLFVSLPNMIFISLLCLLSGGLLGAFSAFFSAAQREKERLHDVMQTLASSETSAVSSPTNGFRGEARTDFLKMLKPRGAYSGVSLVVIKGPLPVMGKAEQGEKTNE